MSITERAEADWDDQERADTQVATEMELNMPPWSSRTAVASQTRTSKKRDRPIPNGDTSDTDREITGNWDRSQGTKQGHYTTPASDMNWPPWRGLQLQDLIPATESSEDSTSTDESMDALRALAEHTTCLKVVSTLNPTKCKHPTQTKGSEDAACFDLHSAQSLNLEPEMTTLINIDLKLEIPKGYSLLLLFTVWHSVTVSTVYYSCLQFCTALQ